MSSGARTSRGGRDQFSWTDVAADKDVSQSDRLDCSACRGRTGFNARSSSVRERRFKQPQISHSPALFVSLLCLL